MGSVAEAEPPSDQPPQPIRAEHRVDGFDCGKPPLDDWLRAHALANEGRASRTFVVIDAELQVQAYYTLAAGSVVRVEVPGKYRHGLPNPVPVMVLGRLAVDRRQHGRGLGPALLQEAMTRTLRVAAEAGVIALIVHAIDDDAVSFYTRYGFQVFPHGTRTLFLSVATIRAAVGDAP